jgi:hypothetical protein
VDVVATLASVICVDVSRRIVLFFGSIGSYNAALCTVYEVVKMRPMLGCRLSSGSRHIPVFMPLFLSVLEACQTDSVTTIRCAFNVTISSDIQ